MKVNIFSFLKGRVTKRIRVRARGVPVGSATCQECDRSAKYYCKAYLTFCVSGKGHLYTVPQGRYITT